MREQGIPHYAKTTTAPADGGKYAVTAEVVDKNYYGSYQGKLWIQKATQKISTASKINVTYGDDPFAVNALAKTDVSYQLVSGRDVISVSEEGMVAVKSAGSAVIQLHARASRNYLPADTEVTINVAKSGAEAISIQDSSTTYQASPVPALCKVYGASTYETFYEGVGETQYEKSNLPPTDAGTYKVTVYTTDKNYESINSSARLTIVPAPLQVNVQNANRLTGEKNPAFVSQITGLLGKDDAKLQYSCTAKSDSPVGTYEITAVCKNTNYVATVENGKLEISSHNPYTDHLYTVKGDQTENGWFTGTYTISPNGTLGYDQIWNGETYVNQLTVDASTTPIQHSVPILLGKSTTGAYTDSYVLQVNEYAHQIELDEKNSVIPKTITTGAACNLKLSFSEKMREGKGEILVYDAAGKKVASGGSELLSYAGNEISFSLKNVFQSAGQYRIVIEKELMVDQYRIVIEKELMVDQYGVCYLQNLEFPLLVTDNAPACYQILDISNQVDNSGEDPLVVRIDAPIEKFVKVFIDHQQLGSDTYSITGGSTVVTVSSAYLQTLQDGTHTMHVAFSDGYTDLEFSMKKIVAGNSSTPSPSRKPSNIGENPATGDTRKMPIFLCEIGILSLGFVFFLTRRKRKGK